MITFSKLENRYFKITMLVVLISSSVGILFECGQYSLTSNRQFSYLDATANVFGALLGVMVFWCFHFRHKRILQ
jgi:glycopeptide antibiotics resistance protein